MKKYILYSFLFSLIFPNISFGFLSDSLGLDMYKKIDKGLIELELKYLEKELKGGDVGGDISQDLNKRAKANGFRDTCFKKGITVKDIKEAANDSNIKNIINETCFSPDRPISQLEFNSFMDILKESYAENSLKAEEKVNTLHQIGRIGMYSDGVEENSPFDLMKDLDDIDKIIFEQPIPYNGVNNEDVGKVVDAVFSGFSPDVAFELGKYSDNIIFQGKYKDPPKDEEKKKNETIHNINGQCTVNNSGLNNTDFQVVLESLEKTTKTELSDENNHTHNEKNNGTLEEKSEKKSGYSKVKDDDVWPCNNFFCIKIDFKTYQFNLLGGGTDLSIEGLVKRSNNHFKKFASTSLIQSNMTINLFQLGLKDLNLPDTFHVGTQVSYKPVPLLNVEKDGKEKESDEFKYKNLLTRYYRNLGLDYERSNDLTILAKEESELKSLLDGTEQNQTQAAEKFVKQSKVIKELSKQNNFVSNTIVDKKILQDDMQDFYQQFIEIESFTNAMLDYVLGTQGVVNKMKEIPIKN